MQVTETQAEGLKHEYKIQVEAAEIEKKIEERLQELNGQVRIPGFRPGKVPLTLLRKRFGPSVMGEVLEKTVNDTSSQAISERGLRPALQPKIEITSFDEGKDLEYTISLEVLPKIEPMDFSKLTLEKIAVDVPDTEVDEALGRIAESHKKTQPLAKARKAKNGDVLVIDFKGSVDGEELPGMSGEDYHLELGSGRFIPGFEDQLVGSKKDEQKTLTVTFPEDYGNERLAGQDAIFEVSVKDVLESVPVPIDDDFAVTLGEENLAALKERVREQVGREYASITRNELKRKLLDALAENHDFEVPSGMVENEFETIWKQIEHDREHGELDPEDEGKSEEEIKGDYRRIAERRVRLGLLLAEVGRANSIEVSQDEMNQALFSEAQRYPGQEAKVFEFYQKNAQAQASLRAPIFEDKVVDFITDLANTTEKKISPEELQAMLQEDESEKPKATAKKTKAKVNSGGTAAKSRSKKGAKAPEQTAAEQAGETETSGGADAAASPTKRPARKEAPAKKAAAKKVAKKVADKDGAESE
jgi:trigger factor